VDLVVRGRATNGCCCSIPESEFKPPSVSSFARERLLREGFGPHRPISNDLKSLSTSASTPASSSSSDSTSQEPLSKRFKPNGFGRLSSTKQSSSTSDWKFGDVLKGFRVNMKDLKKRDEYQVRSHFG